MIAAAVLVYVVFAALFVLGLCSAAKQGDSHHQEEDV